MRASEEVKTKAVSLAITCVGKIFNESMRSLSNKSKSLRTEPWGVALHVASLPAPEPQNREENTVEPLLADQVLLKSSNLSAFGDVDPWASAQHSFRKVLSRNSTLVT